MAIDSSGRRADVRQNMFEQSAAVSCRSEWPLTRRLADLLEQFQPARVDLASFNRAAYRATRFVQVVAVVEAALAAVRRELDESFFYSAEAQVVQAECLNAGAVDQAALVIQSVQACVGGGVLA